MLSLTEIKPGKKIILGENPFVVLVSHHSKKSRAGAVLKTKLKNLVNGSILNKTFQGAEKVEEAEVGTKKAQYLYSDENAYFFMDSENFEQFELSKDVIGDSSVYLKEGTDIDIFYFNGSPINIELPIKMEFVVTEAPPAVKGNTTDGGSKQITLETGLRVSAPLFVKTGDVVRINTETGEYAERVS